VEAAPANEETTLDVHGLTHVGKKRDENQDQFLISELSKSMLIHQTSLPEPDRQRLFSPSQGKLFLVADGMGGYGGGEVASTLAVYTIAGYMLNLMPWFLGLEESREDDLRDELGTALEKCNKNVVSLGKKSDEHAMMGTTLTMAYVVWPRLYVVHAGDSRCYLYRPPTLEQITEDHTVAEKMMDKELLKSQDVGKSRWSNVLWNAVGGGMEEISPEVYKAELKKGDMLLLCTDGLTKHVSDERIVNILTRPLTAPRETSEAKAEKLVDAANRSGGTDNITAVVAHFG
jgi:protein phosphatase